MAGLLDFLRDYTAAAPVNPILDALGWNPFPAKNNGADAVADALAERKAARARDGLEPFRFDWSKLDWSKPGDEFGREYNRQLREARRRAAYVNNMPNPSGQILTATPPTRAGILGTLVEHGLEYFGAPRGVQHDAGSLTRSMAEGALLGAMDKADSGDIPGALEYLAGGPALGMAKKALPTMAAKVTKDVISELPMDEASRMARAKAMGYSDDVFWRGEATGKLPSKYQDRGFFSRDRDYAAGFAQKGGQPDPREFRLDLSKAFTSASR